ncbi:hypothetical protein NEISICOT_00726 [Neisseria sicca ATCC 29256]|uniref:Uncharacterized protein n=1 Tax=Neisseria sicca ATCC 29256 TaxID=547045 RepID=C6M2I7_NEISI|nr:hypothetical protein NEISICOT_00726 [Neisseria sicca ATCC 29256]
MQACFRIVDNLGQNGRSRPARRAVRHNGIQRSNRRRMPSSVHFSI